MARLPLAIGAALLIVACASSEEPNIGPDDAGTTGDTGKNDTGHLYDTGAAIDSNHAADSSIVTGDAGCPSACSSNSECVTGCAAAPSGSEWCCDQSGSCYKALGMCPVPSGSDASMTPPY